MLKSNELLESICNRLAALTPNWKGTIEKMKELRPNMCSRDIYINERRSHFSEVYLQNSLKNICKRMKRVDLNPIPDGACSEHYVFQVRNGRLVVEKDKKSYTDYDALIKVDDLPVIFEMRISKMFASRRGTNKVLHLERVYHVAVPVQEYFQSEDFGYVAIITKENVKDCPLQRDFKEGGGILVPFFWSSLGFKLKFYHYACKYKLYEGFENSSKKE